MKRHGSAIFAAAITAILGGLSLMALGLSPEARLVPLIIGIPATIMGFITVRNELAAGSRATDSDAATPLDRKAERLAIAWIAGFWLAVLLFGFIVGAPVFTAVYLAVALRQGVLATAAGGIGCLLLTEGLFVRLLGIPLFNGLLLP